MSSTHQSASAPRPPSCACHTTSIRSLRRTPRSSATRRSIGGSAQGSLWPPCSSSVSACRWGYSYGRESTGRAVQLSRSASRSCWRATMTTRGSSRRSTCYASGFSPPWYSSYIPTPSGSLSLAPSSRAPRWASISYFSRTRSACVVSRPVRRSSSCRRPTSSRSPSTLKRTNPS